MSHHSPGSAEPPHAVLADLFGAELLNRWYGLYPGTVIDVRDIHGQGRVKVSLPWASDLDGGTFEPWARLSTPMAGPGRGTWFVPETGDEVLVGFQAGDPRCPIVLGSVWNGKDKPPVSMDQSGLNNIRVIHSRAGHQIRLDDTRGKEQIDIKTPGGQRITLTDSPPSVELADSNGNVVRLTSSGITLTSNAKVTISASSVEISASSVSVKTGMSTFSGVAKADSVISNTVIGTTYLPGAGNMW